MKPPELSVVVPPPSVTDPITVLIAIAMGIGILVAGYALILVAQRFMTARRAGEFDRTAAQAGVVLAAVMLILSASEIVVVLALTIF